VTEALHEGELSTAQLALVTSTSAEVPDASGHLLELMDQGASHQELSGAATQMRAASRSRETERARRARVHTNRHVRWRQDEGGGVRGAFFCDEVAWARVAPRLEAEAKQRWRAGGAKDGESLDAYRLDAFVDLLSGSGGSETGGGAAPRTLIIVNAESLRRGSTQGDELCEIDGIGPVSVDAATELLSEGGFQYLVKEGFDIKTMTRSTRVIRNCIDLALMVRDRVCAVPGCAKRLGLERDHFGVDYKDGGPSELANLVRLCPEHHALKTYGGWKLGGGPGNWKWIAPAHPKSAQYIARARQMAAAKAKAKRNTPRRS
jgi:hypothetical protein